MTLTETLRLPLAHQIHSTYTFDFDKANKEWTVNGHVVIDAPAEDVKLDQKFAWTFPNRGLTSHLPKLRLREQMGAWKLGEHPHTEQMFEILDMQFRNEREKHIADIFEVYETGDATNF